MILPDHVKSLDLEARRVPPPAGNEVLARFARSVVLQPEHRIGKAPAFENPRHLVYRLATEPRPWERLVVILYRNSEQE